MGYCRRAGRFCLVDEMYMAVGACFEHTLEVRECGIPPPGRVARCALTIVRMGGSLCVTQPAVRLCDLSDTTVELSPETFVRHLVLDDRMLTSVEVFDYFVLLEYRLYGLSDQNPL